MSRYSREYGWTSSPLPGWVSEEKTPAVEVRDVAATILRGVAASESLSTVWVDSFQRDEVDKTIPAVWDLRCLSSCLHQISWWRLLALQIRRGNCPRARRRAKLWQNRSFYSGVWGRLWLRFLAFRVRILCLVFLRGSIGLSIRLVPASLNLS